VLALGYGRLRRIRKETRSMNCVENTLTEIGSKWPKKKKRRREVRESESLNEKTEEDISTRKMDRGQLSKQKKPLIDALDHFAGKKERRVGEALKMWVKLT
jgi:hypothetical protein